MSNSNPVLVIGGAGFVGRHLVAILREKGYRVRVFSRHAGAGRRPEADLEFVQGEVADAAAVMAAVKGAQAVYDLSLGARSSLEDVQRDYVQGTTNVINACREHGARRLIYTSTIAVLDQGLRDPIDESVGIVPKVERMPGFYHKGKIAAERILLDWHAKTGFPAVILRPGLVMGAGGKLRHAAIGDWVNNTCCLIAGSGRHPLPFVLVSELADAFFLALDAPGIDGMCFNLVGDVRPSALEFVAWVRERSLRNFRAYPGSLAKSYGIALFKSLIKLLMRKPGAEIPNWEGIRQSSLKTQYDCSRAKRLLGWKPTRDVETFCREAIDPHLKPILPGDLRLPVTAQ